MLYIGITNMLLPLDVSNHSKTTMVKHRKWSNILTLERLLFTCIEKNWTLLLCKANFLHSEKHHISVNSGLYWYNPIKSLHHRHQSHNYQDIRTFLLLPSAHTPKWMHGQPFFQFCRGTFHLEGVNYGHWWPTYQVWYIQLDYHRTTKRCYLHTRGRNVFLQVTYLEDHYLLPLGLFPERHQFHTCTAIME